MGSVARSSSARAPAGAGFTLVEILVVLIVLGIAASVAVVVFTGDERGSATREARRFAGALEHAALRARVRAETLGVSANANVWRFWRRNPDSNQWLPVADDDVLAAHALPRSMSVAAIAYAGQPIAANAIVPLRPTGRNEPFAFALQSSVTTFLLAADPLNRVALSATDMVNKATPAP